MKPLESPGKGWNERKRERMEETSHGAPGHGSGPRQPAIRVVLMPKDTNALGTIFGGIIISYIDQAGAVEAHHHVPLPGRLVTVAMREVVFHSPVFVGDLVVVFQSGAYGPTASPTGFLGHPAPLEVLV